MKTSTIISATTGLLASTVTAAATPKTYSLKTKSTDSRFDSICVTPFHTGAGLNDAVLGPCSKKTSLFYSTTANPGAVHIESTLSGPGNPPDVFNAYPGATYDEWYPATIDAGANSIQNTFAYTNVSGFKANGAASDPSASTGNVEYGFIACNWAHGGAPQLFVLAQAEEATKFPGSCALVDLVMG